MRRADDEKTSPFPTGALEANRGGALTDDQRRNLGALAGERRRNALSIAAFLTAGALIVIFFARADAPVLARQGLSGGALVLAAFLVVRSITGSDALTRDLEDARVQSVEGAIGKRRVGGGRARSTYFIVVANQRFRVGGAAYEWMPWAGLVRVYFLPLSRRVVNAEVLPDTASPGDVSGRHITQLLGTALLSSDQEANEARAEIAGIGNALRPAFEDSPQPPPAGARDPRALADAIVGSWRSGGIRATFSPDGTLVVGMLVGEQKGRWSVDAAGRLHAEISGREQSAEASIAGDRLTIVLDGRGLTLTRDQP